MEIAIGMIVEITDFYGDGRWEGCIGMILGKSNYMDWRVLVDDTILSGIGFAESELTPIDYQGK